jgi:hypothetical protein
MKLALKVLSGLIKGCLPAQNQLFQTGAVQSLYALADASLNIAGVGKLAQEIIDYLANPKSIVDSAVHAFISQLKERDEKMRSQLAKAKKAKKLQEILKKQ